MVRSPLQVFRSCCKSPYPVKGVFLQRLFSMFANGWPGTGLLLLRLVTGAALIHYDSANLRDAAQFVPIISQIIGAGAGILLLVGLWTPVAGEMVAIVEVWIGLTRPGDPWI